MGFALSLQFAQIRHFLVCSQLEKILTEVLQLKFMNINKYEIYQYHLLYQDFSGLKCFGTQIFRDSHFSGLTFFGTHIFRDSHFSKSQASKTMTNSEQICLTKFVTSFYATAKKMKERKVWKTSLCPICNMKVIYTQQKYYN